MRISLLSVCLLAIASAASGQHISFGAIGGANLASDFRSFDTGKSYILGSTVELSLPFHLSVEVDGLYRPLQNPSIVSLIHGPIQIKSTSGTIATGEFPILAKYRFPFPVLKPFAAVGPSFRTSVNLYGVSSSTKGFTLGGGVEAHLLLFRITPQIRYTRWGSDQPGSPSLTNQNEAQLLVSFSFR